MRYAIRSIVAFCVLFCQLHAAPPEPVLAVKGLDPIALSQGHEIPGLDSLEIRHGLFRYRFANPDNKAAFEAAPEQRGIQFGGACGKMGPFSGSGSPERFFVHDRRIYIFASESCRASFKSDPESHIERPNPVPQGTAQARQCGTELVDLALAGFGGADRVDGLRNLQEFTRRIYKQGDKEFVSSHLVAWEFPNKVRITEQFTNPYGFIVNGDTGFEIYNKESWELESSLRSVAWRQALRQPLAMLRNRHAAGFVAIANGSSPVGDMAVERLAVAMNGATSIWSIEPQTGRIVQIEYRARRGTVGDNVVQFSDFRPVDGLVLPYQREILFSGKPVTSPENQIEQIVVNGDLPPETFVP